MRRMVVVGLVGGAVVVGAVVVVRRRAAPAPAAVGVPDWAPLRLAEPVPSADPTREPWVAPDAAGDCPGSHPIKGNRASRIFHVPGGRYYESTRAERCFCDEAAAVADGYRPAKR
jgi:large subunit ribosomal protein L17